MATVWEATDNYAFGTLKFGINTASTQITFNTGEGDYFDATLENRVVIFGQAYTNPSDDSNREIVRITQNAGDIYDITDGAPTGRGLEGTIAGTWAINDKVALVMTQVTIDAIHTAINTAENDIDTNAASISDLEDGTTPAGDATEIGGRVPTVTPTADSIPISQAAAAPLALGWMNFQYNVYQAQRANNTAPAIDPSAGGVRNLRTLNTTLNQTITGSSRSGTTFILPAGTYHMTAWGCYGQSVQGVRTFVYNITDAADALIGISCWNNNSTSYAEAEVSGYVTIAGTKSFRLETYTASGQTNGLGSPSNEGSVEVYAHIEIKRVA